MSETVVALVLASSAEAVPGAQDWFRTAGFVTGPASGPTFAVEGPARMFAEALGALPVPAGDGGWTTSDGDELPLDGLPAEVRAAVALERPFELHHPPTAEGER